MCYGYGSYGKSMTASQIARSLHGVKAGRGFMCRCPCSRLHSHGDRSRSLSIRESNDGWVMLKCFAGCTRAEILDAMGLKVRDLALRSPPDKAAMEAIRAEQERRDALKERRTELLWLAQKRIEYWRRKVQTLGRSLDKWPDLPNLARDFHHALNMERRCQRIWETL